MLAEALASLALAHVLSELALQPSRWSSRWPLLAATALACQLGAAVYAWASTSSAGASAQGEPCSGSMLAVPLLIVALVGIFAGMEDAPSQRLQAAVGVILVTLLLAAGHVYDLPKASTVGRLWLLAISHVGVCAVTSRRASPGLPMRIFGECLCKAMAYVAPAYPVLLLGSSVLLLAASRLAGIPLKHAHAMIDWGSINLPLWAVSFWCKRYCQIVCNVGARSIRDTRSDKWQTLLPLTQASIREKRESFFMCRHSC